MTTEKLSEGPLRDSEVRSLITEEVTRLMRTSGSNFSMGYAYSIGMEIDLVDHDGSRHKSVLNYVTQTGDGVKEIADGLFVDWLDKGGRGLMGYVITEEEELM